MMFDHSQHDEPDWQDHLSDESTNNSYNTSNNESRTSNPDESSRDSHRMELPPVGEWESKGEVIGRWSLPIVGVIATLWYASTRSICWGLCGSAILAILLIFVGDFIGGKIGKMLDKQRSPA